MRIFAPLMKKTFLLPLLTLFFACQTSENSTLLSAEAFNEQLSAPGIQILDVRTPEEFAEGHLANAVNIDVQSDGFEAASAVLYKDVPVYVYCRKGQRSQEASKRLKAIGFEKIFEMTGGITDWQSKGLPVVKAEPPKIYANDTIPFEKAIMGNKLVMVDFNATWCGPCKILQPTIDRIHDKRTDDVIVYSIDVDKRQDLAAQYQAERIPLIMMFKNGKVVHRSEGVVEEGILNQVIDKNK